MLREGHRMLWRISGPKKDKVPERRLVKTA
jgi:hypothetical protein